MTGSLLAATPRLLAVAEEIAADWRALGIAGSFLARDLPTGEELGFDVDRPVVLASVVKVPIALVVLQHIAEGRLDPVTQLHLVPGASALGPTGTAAFAHPASVAVGDLVALMVTVSDNAAADRLLALIAPAEVERMLAGFGYPEIRVRHRMQPMYEAASRAAGDDVDVALELALEGERSGVHAIQSLDPARGNVATARALVGLLGDVWGDRIGAPAATAELRRLMRMQLFTHRLSSDLRTDAVRVAGKTGSFLHLRHEIGVVESSAGDRVAVAALTRSGHRATLAPDVDLAIGAAARRAFEALRR